MREKVKFPGTVISLQNMDIELPALNFRQLSKEGAMDKLDTVQNAFMVMQAERKLALPTEALEAAIDLVHMAASRNYPDVTRDQIAEGLTFASLQKALPALFSLNETEGLPKADPN